MLADISLASIYFTKYKNYTKNEPTKGLISAHPHISLCMQVFVNGKLIMTKTIQQFREYMLSLLLSGGKTKDCIH